MKRVCPGSLQYAVIRNNPVAMVEHFSDPIATDEAKRMPTKKYLVYLNHAIDLPFPTSEWFRFEVSPIGTAPPKDAERGITPDMCIPVYPNQDPSSGRAPIRTSTPFPFGNCYHWADSETTVRVRRNPDLYDDSVAVNVSSLEHVRIGKLFGEDAERIDDFLDAREAEDLAKRRASRSHSPSSQDSRLSATLDDADSDLAGIPRSRALDGDDDDDSSAEDPVEGLLRMDIFSLLHHDDDSEETLPLVDLWFDLERHLSESDIPSPFELYKECAAIAKIVRDARSRNPNVPFPRRNGALGVDSENGMSADEDEYGYAVDAEEDREVYMNDIEDDEDDTRNTEDESEEEVPLPVSSSHSWPIPIPSALFHRHSSACSSHEGSPGTSPNTSGRRDLFGY
ncbi:hypothetical protein C2E23DRAFT_811542 [Lenzites betulinus]|nr:hypothetical protein C2E23DRAFT_811542 [Lenzites betulinus]